MTSADVLAFPGLFPGALDAWVRDINEEMHMAARMQSQVWWARIWHPGA